MVLPALSASRTSIHVISSSHTVWPLGSGLGASAQLYGLSRQSPPPIERGSGARRCAAAAATDAPATSTHGRESEIDFFMSLLL